MLDRNLKKSIREAIFQLLNEDDSKDDPKDDSKEKKKKSSSSPAPGSISIRPGGIGRGRFKAFVNEAKARAQSDPEGLVKDLGVKSVSGKDLDQIVQIFNAAIHTNTVMGEAYTGAAKKAELTESGDQMNVVAVMPSGLDARNGIKFLAYTLEAAKATGDFNPRGAIVFSKGKYFPIIVYSL